ncbi:MAG TPA: hypothetical protein VN642_07510 [Dongiaceae bacterium]|nr:hypothetical protein [Dongiaceae bacterium]
MKQEVRIITETVALDGELGMPDQANRVVNLLSGSLSCLGTVVENSNRSGFVQ